MCGRYTQLMSWRELVALYEITNLDFKPNLPPRYNAAPTQDLPVVRLSESGARELAVMRWGLVPAWAKEIGIGARMINARSEEAAGKPAFRGAYKRRRCLVPADGFYEWREQPKAGKGPKSKASRQPYYISMADGGPMTFAGLWERWTNPADGQPVESFTILTTEANDLVAEIHAKKRMPVILDQLDFATWLDASGEGGENLFRPYPAEAMKAHPVSPEVNKAWDAKSNTIVDHPGLTDPLPEPAQGLLL